jgi:hypothetical protein
VVELFLKENSPLDIIELKYSNFLSLFTHFSIAFLIGKTRSVVRASDDLSTHILAAAACKSIALFGTSSIATVRD